MITSEYTEELCEICKRQSKLLSLDLGRWKCPQCVNPELIEDNTKINKCFICGENARSNIILREVCQNHFRLIKKLKKDEHLWKIIGEILEGKNAKNS